jgi:hypothetical protein
MDVQWMYPANAYTDWSTSSRDGFGAKREKDYNFFFDSLFQRVLAAFFAISFRF